MLQKRKASRITKEIKLDLKNYTKIKEWLKSKNLQKKINNLSRKYKGKKILIYGADLMSEAIFDNYNLSELNIIGVADNKFYNTDSEFKGYKTIPLYFVEEFQFDAIFIFLYNSSRIKKFIKEDLLPEHYDFIQIEKVIPKDFLTQIIEISQF